MDLTLPIITPHDLEQAREWGDGWCVACGATQTSVEGGACVQECTECGERAVLSAEGLAFIARRIVE